MITILFGTVLPWLLIAIGTWLVYQLARQNGRILLRLESIEKQIGLRAELSTKPRAGANRREGGGLPLGTVAPDFELPDLTGVRHKLSEFREQNVLLIFFNPQCGFCTKMAADLADLPAEGGDGRAVPVVVTTGDAEENRKLVERYGIRCLVLLQEQMEVASKFRAQGTPMGYRIDGAGRIASELAVGAEPLLRLATTTAPHQNESGGFANGSAPHGAKNDRSLARSRLNRNGLKAGAPAPDFRLPCIDEGDLIAQLVYGAVAVHPFRYGQEIHRHVQRSADTMVPSIQATQPGKHHDRCHSHSLRDRARRPARLGGAVAAGLRRAEEVGGAAHGT